jgi:gamma-glutamylcyclotransferase (GGCT)/AIG2-like uncharacterized protein YtfP
MRGQANLLAPEARAGLAYLGPCRIPGRILLVVADHGGAPFPHPALVDAPGREVQGELFRADGPAVLAALDAYEDFRPADPGGSMYLRRLLPVAPAAGPPVQAWVYVWNRPAEGLAEIAGGDWRAAALTPPPPARGPR